MAAAAPRAAGAATAGGEPAAAVAARAAARAFRLAVALAAATAAAGAAADEATIRRAIAERLPDFPKIDEVRPMPVPGLFEIRVGTQVLYTDARGDHLFQGVVIDTRTRENLTEARVERLTVIDFAALPLRDAVVLKQGTGTRRMAVFEDPNCGFCKRFERDLRGIDDLTVYIFLYPILGQDSQTKSRDIWCAADPAKAWRDWMLDGVVPPRAAAGCDSAALQRNVAFGQKVRVQGTPALVFEDGTRKPGALPRAQVEQLLAAATARVADRPAASGAGTASGQQAAAPGESPRPAATQPVLAEPARR
ncbi:MAG: DsbC family protein [Burkholderiales bacterium]|nr:DsbC family protein [Burkholderiales bacterium]